MFSKHCHTSPLSLRHSVLSSLFLLQLLPVAHSRFSLVGFTLWKTQTFPLQQRQVKGVSSDHMVFFLGQILRLKVYVRVYW